MADTIKAKKHQSMTEVRQWDFDFGPDLPSGVTLESVEVTHIPPSGDETTPVVGTIVDDIAPVQFGPVDVCGVHELIAEGTCSDGEILTIRLQVPVDY